MKLVRFLSEGTFWILDSKFDINFFSSSEDFTFYFSFGLFVVICLSFTVVRCIVY